MTTAVVGNLPPASPGAQYCLSNGNNGTNPTTGALSFKTSGSGQYILFTDGTYSASGGSVQSAGAAADFGSVLGLDSSHWLFRPAQGTWTKH